MPESWDQNLAAAYEWAESVGMKVQLISWAVPHKWQGQVEDTAFTFLERHGQYKIQIQGAASFLYGSSKEVTGAPVEVVKWLHKKIRQFRGDCCYCRGCDCYENE